MLLKPGKQTSYHLGVLHQSCLRRIVWVKFLNHVRNSEILKRTDQLQIRLHVTIRRLRRFRHVSRMDDDRLLKYLLEWHLRRGKRTRGRKRTTWLSCIEEDLEMVTKRVGIDYIERKQMVVNRLRWRAMLRKANEVVVEQLDQHTDYG